MGDFLVKRAKHEFAQTFILWISMAEVNANSYQFDKRDLAQACQSWHLVCGNPCGRDHRIFAQLCGLGREEGRTTAGAKSPSPHFPCLLPPSPHPKTPLFNSLSIPANALHFGTFLRADWNGTFSRPHPFQIPSPQMKRKFGREEWMALTAQTYWAWIGRPKPNSIWCPLK